MTPSENSSVCTPRCFRSQHRVRDGADAGLQRRAVRDQFGDLAGDPDGQIRGGRHVDFRQVVIHLNDVVQLRHMDERVAQCPRHLRIDFRDHVLGGLRRRLGHADLDAERAEAVLVRRADVNQRHVDRQIAVLEQQRDLGQEARREIAASLVDRRPLGVADEERVDADVPGQFGRGVRRLAKRQHLHQFDIGQFRRPPHQRPDHHLRHRAIACHEDALTRLDAADGGIGRHHPLAIGIHEAHSVTSGKPRCDARRASTT
jgi:hypothetical protein